MASDVAPTLLISGSRDATEAMLAYAERAVARAKNVGYQIIVGDAKGVDQMVIWSCEAWEVALTIQGARGVIRANYEPCALIKTIALPTKSYRVRDQDMINHADYVLCIWNGRSRGTKYVHDYAVSAPGPKQVWLKKFSE